MPARPELLPPVESEIARFGLLLRHLLGLQFEADRQEALAEILQRRAQSRRTTAAGYLAVLARASGAEIAGLAEELTVTETSFFRNSEHMRAFEALVQDPARNGLLRILSAGCASGEEPYSLAMIAAAAGREPAPSIQAVDINGAALRAAAAGRYSPWSLRQTPASFRARFFRSDGAFFVLDQGIRRMVDFSQRNLAGGFDIVFCRNVLMYFAPEAARRAVARIARSLAPGGFLFLGHAETLRGISGDFQLLHSHGTFYYQRKDAPAEPLQAPLPPPDRAGAAAHDLSWFGNILRASARVRALTAPPGGGRDD